MRNRLEFYAMHLGQPVRDCGPALGHRLYSEYLEELLAAERLGYDGVWIYEDQPRQSRNGAAPSSIAFDVASLTERISIGVVGDAPPLDCDPLGVAEHVAALDVASRGRAVVGFVRGTGTEHEGGRGGLSFSEDRLWETHDLITRAWTEEAPFEWRSAHYGFDAVALMERPLQRPHPPVWLAGSRSFETIEQAAARRYTFMTTFAPQWLTKASFDMYRGAARKHGYEPSPAQLAAAVPVYAAETDEQARHLAERPLMQLFANRLHGYRELTWEELLGERYAIVGSPATVVAGLTELSDELGAGTVVGAGGRIGEMSHSAVMESMQLIAKEVIPSFQPDLRPLPWPTDLDRVRELKRSRLELPERAAAAARFTESRLAGDGHRLGA